MAEKILYDDVLSVQYLKKQVFTGSFKGMRYRLWSEETDGSRVLKLVTWPEPLCYEASDPETHVALEFPYSEEGRIAAIDYLNNNYTKYAIN